MQYKTTKKILIDKRKLDILLRLNCPKDVLYDVIIYNKITKTGDDLIDDNLESLIDIKEFSNWGGKRPNSGRKNHLENQVENHLENQEVNQVVDKDKDIDKDNTTNKQIDTINNNDEKIKKLDPYMNSIRTLFIQEYQKVFNSTPRLAAFECQRLIELAKANEDIKELIPIALKRLKKIKWDQISYKPCANWLLKENNFERVINGEFEPQKSSYERLMEKYGGSNG